MANLNIAIKIAAQDNASGPIGRITNSLTGLKDRGLGGLQAAGAVAMTGLAVGAGAVVGAVGLIGAAAFGVANDVNTATGQIQSQLGTTAEEAENLANVAADVWGNNFAGSISEAANAVGLVRQQLGDLSNNELQSAAENAFRLQDNFEIGVVDSISAANTLMENFGLTSDEAFDFIASGMQRGLDRSGDFLDTIGEYSTQFSNGGADAGQFFSLLESGLQGGMLGTDKAADAFKEFRVRIQDGSTLTAEALEMIGLSADDISQRMADGSLTAADAFTMVVDGLNEIDDENIRMQAGVGLLGTQFEDLGTAGALGLSLVGTEMGELAGATETLDAKYANLGSAAEGYKRRALLALEPIGNGLLALANNAMPLVDRAFAFFETSVVPVLADVGSGIQGFISELQNGLSVWDAAVEAILNWTDAGEANFDVILNTVIALEDFGLKVQSILQPVIDWISGNVELSDVLIGLGIVLASVIIPAAITLAGTILAIAAPVVAVIAAVALLRTAWENDWGGIQGKTAAVLGWLQSTIASVMAGVQAFWAANGAAIMATAQTVWTGIQTAVNTAITTIQTIITTVVTAIQTFWTAHGDTIMETAAAAWEFIQTYIDTALSVVSSVFAAFKSAFEGDWTAFGENLRAAWDTAWEFVKTTFTNAKETIIGIAAGLVLDLIAKFQNTDWRAVGTAIIQGIANGISAGAGAIADAAMSAAQAALDAAKGFLGIQSPSKVAALQIGRPFVEGMAQGLGDVAPVQRGISDLVDELMLPFGSVGLPASASPAAPRQLATSGGSSTTIIFERGAINAAGAAPGMEKLIRDEIERMFAAKGRQADIYTRTR